MAAQQGNLLRRNRPRSECRWWLPSRFRDDGESYLTFLNIKDSIGRIALNENRLLIGNVCDLAPTVDGRKECLGIEFATFLGRYFGSHVSPAQSSERTERNFLE